MAAQDYHFDVLCVSTTCHLTGAFRTHYTGSRQGQPRYTGPLRGEAVDDPLHHTPQLHNGAWQRTCTSAWDERFEEFRIIFDFKILKNDMNSIKDLQMIIFELCHLSLLWFFLHDDSVILEVRNVEVRNDLYHVSDLKEYDIFFYSFEDTGLQYLFFRILLL